MSTVERITAALDKAEKRLDAATGVPWQATDWSPRTIMPAPWAEDVIEPDDRGPFLVINVGGDGYEADPNADLIVSVVNRERAQIQHARDVLARHEPEEGVEVMCDDVSPTGGPVCDDCPGHEITACVQCLGYEGYRYAWPCIEITSLLAVWCPEPTP